MFVTESELRELWQNGRRPLPTFPPDTRFSPSALDFLKDHGLNVQFTAAPAAAPAAPPLPGVLQARLDVLQALAGLAAAQARSYRLGPLADRLDALAAQCGPLPGEALAPPAPLEMAARQPGKLDHAIVHWLRLLRAEALSVAALARASAAPAEMAVRLEAVGQSIAALEGQFRSGGLAWMAGP